MKHLQIIAPVVLSLVVFTGSAAAQKKPVRKTPVKNTPVKAVIPPLDVRAAREKVEVQLSNVNRFVDVLGPIAQGIETLDQSATQKPLAKATADKNETNKVKVVEAIRNLKTGLATLESEFRTKPALQKYLVNIQGITDLAALSEDSAIAGKFVAAKDPLRDVAQKLTDTLAVLPR
jgi:predicted transport protein